MLEKGIFLIITVLFLTIIMVVAIIIAIVYRKNKGIRNGGIAVSIISLILLAGTVIYTTVLTFKTVKKKGEETATVLAHALGEALAASHPDSPFLDSIKSMQPMDQTIPNPYFYCAGFRDYYRMPLIYPYSVISIDVLSNAYINDETGIEDVFNDSNSSKTVISHVSKITFNKDYLLAESYTNQDTVYYRLDFKTKQVQEFVNKNKLDEFVKTKNDTSLFEMISISDYYNKFRTISQ